MYVSSAKEATRLWSKMRRRTETHPCWVTVEGPRKPVERQRPPIDSPQSWGHVSSNPEPPPGLTWLRLTSENKATYPAPTRSRPLRPLGAIQCVNSRATTPGRKVVFLDFSDPLPRPRVARPGSLLIRLTRITDAG